MSNPARSEVKPEQTAPIEGLTWKSVLEGERQAEYFKRILSFISDERRKGATIYPPNPDIFNALHHTPFADVRVVILGQDPYHGPLQAHGLAFSVRKGIPTPPSLQNIYKELNSDLGIPIPAHGCLETWAKQGVLLLNTTLTVEGGKPQSHAGIGWDRFTDRIISELNAQLSHVVFLLWGSHAQKKAQFVDRNRHLVLESPHPSPLSAHRGFLGCRHFSKANAYLQEAGRGTINWALE